MYWRRLHPLHTQLISTFCHTSSSIFSHFSWYHSELWQNSIMLPSSHTEYWNNHSLLYIVGRYLKLEEGNDCGDVLSLSNRLCKCGLKYFWLDHFDGCSPIHYDVLNANANLPNHSSYLMIHGQLPQCRRRRIVLQF